MARGTLKRDRNKPGPLSGSYTQSKLASASPRARLDPYLRTTTKWGVGVGGEKGSVAPEVGQVWTPTYLK